MMIMVRYKFKKINFEGLGDLVGIPVVMISHFDGENIKSAVFGESTDNTTNPQD